MGRFRLHRCWDAFADGAADRIVSGGYSNLNTILHEPLSGSRYVLAHEALITKLKERYDENVQSCWVLELEVFLELHTPCKRRIIVPDDLNFCHFHYVLQHCFEWKNNHLHQFLAEVVKAGYAAQVIHPGWNEMEDWENPQVMDSTKVTLREIFDSRKQIVYEYDFGDGWMYTIELCRVIGDCAEPYPHCVMTIGDAHMEDCGGVDGFRQVMAALKDKSIRSIRKHWNGYVRPAGSRWMWGGSIR